MANVVITVLSLTIGFFFILVGTLKLTPSLNEEVYREMRKMFIRDVKVFPLVNQTGWRPNPHTYRKVVGTTEVVAGTVLSIIPGPLKEVANIVLLSDMIGAVYTHYMLGESMDKITPALVFSLLLCCRLVVYLQVRHRNQEKPDDMKHCKHYQKLQKHETTEENLTTKKKEQ